MSRLLIAVIALSVLGFLAYRTLYGRSAVSSDPEAPTQQLENVRTKAKEIEATTSSTSTTSRSGRRSSAAQRHFAGFGPFFIRVT